MMTLEQAKEYTRKNLEKCGYSKEQIENVINDFISVVRPGVVLVKTNCGNIEMYL